MNLRAQEKAALLEEELQISQQLIAILTSFKKSFSKNKLLLFGRCFGNPKLLAAMNALLSDIKILEKGEINPYITPLFGYRGLYENSRCEHPLPDKHSAQTILSEFPLKLSLSHFVILQAPEKLYLYLSIRLAIEEVNTTHKPYQKVLNQMQTRLLTAIGEEHKKQLFAEYQQLIDEAVEKMEKQSLAME